MDSLILSDNGSDMGAEVERLKRIITGEEPHISTISPRKKDLTELEQAAKKAIDATKEGKSSVGKQAKAIYATASSRDALYSIRGRVFMRYAGVNGRVRAAYGRSVALRKAEAFSEK